jgi:hypothetical protein
VYVLEAESELYSSHCMHPRLAATPTYTQLVTGCLGDTVASGAFHLQEQHSDGGELSAKVRTSVCFGTRFHCEGIAHSHDYKRSSKTCGSALAFMALRPIISTFNHELTARLRHPVLLNAYV